MSLQHPRKNKEQLVKTSDASSGGGSGAHGHQGEGCGHQFSPVQVPHARGTSLRQQDGTRCTALRRRVPFPKPFPNWVKMTKMPLSLHPRRVFRQQPGWELSPAPVTLFCHRSRGWLRMSPGRQGQLLYLYTALGMEEDGKHFSSHPSTSWCCRQVCAESDSK